MAFSALKPKALFLVNSVENAQKICESDKTAGSGQHCGAKVGWCLCYTQYCDTDKYGKPIKAQTRRDFTNYKWLSDDGRFNSFLEENKISVLRGIDL